jgi:precorrin-6B C5,15-methyltransferase / cobalt-precorrin-6B C5,C15-methyltransferase
MTAWLHIVGVGETGIMALPSATRTIISFAETVLGPARFLSQLDAEMDEQTGAPSKAVSTTDFVDRRGLEAVARALLEDSLVVAEDRPAAQRPTSELRNLVEWEGSLDNMVAQVERLRDTPTVILATGDPMWFGIGATLARHLQPEEFEVHPYPSAFQLAAAALRWPLQHVATLSLHGRPAELIQPFILPGNRILALTTDAETAFKVADILSARGYADSQMTVLEALGGPDERTITSSAVDFTEASIGDFYVLGIDCVAAPDAPLLSTVPGLPDEAFVSDGQLTKREIRAAALAKLAPIPGALLWDVGAGCGSIAIEWMRAARDARAIAFERDARRVSMIATNANALGVPTLRIEAGTAPLSLAGMPAPDAVFLGGGVGDDALFGACWNALKPGGRFVANAVTIDGEQALYARQATHGGDIVRIETAVLEPLGDHRAMRPRMAVTQWSIVKPTQWLATQ